MYTIKEIADLSNVSTRTLRYYDQIGLLKPSNYLESGYRVYDSAAVDKLQQILFYKSLGLDLKAIKSVLDDDRFDEKCALKSHHQKLTLELERIQKLIKTVEKTLLHLEGEIIMTDQEKFEGHKKAYIDENEKKYGQQAREKFGSSVDASVQKLSEMDEKEFNSLDKLTKSMNLKFKEAKQQGSIDTNLAKEAASMHVKWIKSYWNTYSKAAHIALVEMYVSDERFNAYYENIEPGLAQFVCETVKNYLS